MISEAKEEQTSGAESELMLPLPVLFIRQLNATVVIIFNWLVGCAALLQLEFIQVYSPARLSKLTPS